jgi:hypothetical protein
MTKNVSGLLQRPGVRDRNTAESKRTSGIHLVIPSRKVVVVEQPVRTARVSARNREKMGTVALAGAALMGPVVWLGHALVASLRRQ